MNVALDDAIIAIMEEFPPMTISELQSKLLDIEVLVEDTQCRDCQKQTLYPAIRTLISAGKIAYVEYDVKDRDKDRFFLTYRKSPLPYI